jgi:hypothetical protein
MLDSGLPGRWPRNTKFEMSGRFDLSQDVDGTRHQGDTVFPLGLHPNRRDDPKAFRKVNLTPFRTQGVARARSAQDRELKSEHRHRRDLA